MCIYLAVIGIDGSGKSTCFYRTLKELCKKETVAGIGDAVWLGDKDKGLIESKKIPWLSRKRFLARLTGVFENKTFYQISKFTELVCRVKIQNAIEKKYNPEFILTDGSPLVNIIGWGYFYHYRYFEPKQCIKAITYLCHDKKIPISETAFYIRHIPEIFLANRLRFVKFSRPDIIFLLQIKPEAAIRRILKRGKKRQIHETEEFLDNLQKAYTTVCHIFRSEFNTRIIEISVDDLSIDDIVTTILQHVS